MPIDTSDYELFSIKHRKAANEDYVVRLSLSEQPGGVMEFITVFDGISTASGGISAKICRQAFYDSLRYVYNATLPSLLDLADEGESYETEDKIRERVYQMLVDLIRRINEKLTVYGQQKQISVGSTVSMVIVLGGVIYGANLGDSPIFLFQPDEERMEITKKHFRMRTLYEKQSDGSGLHRWIGDPIKDYSVVHTFACPLDMDNILLLGSDGALSVFEDRDYLELVEDTVNQGGTMKTLCQALRDRIKAADWTVDNASAAALRIGIY